MYADLATYWVSQESGESDPNMDLFCEHIRNILWPLIGRGNRREFQSRLAWTLHERALFIVRLGNKHQLSLGPPDVQRSDVIVTLFGGNAPFVLRPQTCPEIGARLWSLVGVCYIDGLMSAYWTDPGVETGVQPQVYTLV